MEGHYRGPPIEGHYRGPPWNDGDGPMAAVDDAGAAAAIGATLGAAIVAAISLGAECETPTVTGGLEHPFNLPESE